MSLSADILTGEKITSGIEGMTGAAYARKCMRGSVVKTYEQTELNILA